MQTDLIIVLFIGRPLILFFLSHNRLCSLSHGRCRCRRGRDGSSDDVQLARAPDVGQWL